MASMDHDTWTIPPRPPQGGAPATEPGSPAPVRSPAPAGPSPFGEPRRPLLKRAGGALVAAALIAVKLGAKLKAVLLLLPKLKILTTSGTMLVSVAAYSLIWGWTFALGFVLLLLVHELGHVIALRREGIPASAPMFIPFLGAVVSAKSLGDDALAEARVGLAGPVLGSLGAGLLIPIGVATGNDFWLALAFTGLLLNLFNLVPVVPLDGGRAMAAMAPWMWFAGLAVLIALAFAWPNPIIVLIAVLGGLSTWQRWRALRAGGAAAQAYYRVTPRNRALVAGVYLGLIAALVLGMDATHVARELPS